MAQERTLFRCEPDDPLRCQAGTGHGGQCNYLSVDGLVRDQGWVGAGSQYCTRHGGRSKEANAQRKSVHDYNIAMWGERIDEFAESDKVKSLRGEIGLLRHVVEVTMNNCQGDDGQLLMRSSKIADLVSRLERLVRSCDRLEQTSSLTMDRSTALAMGARIVAVIEGLVEDPETCAKISQGIIDIIVETAKQ